MGRVVALSGQGGFIGRHLIRALGASGWQVVPLRRSGTTLVAPDGQVDAVVHLAFPTKAGERRADPLGALEAAVGTTLAALSIAGRSGAHLVVASSGKVYAAPPVLPIDEKHAVAPGTWLGQLKLACERSAELGVRQSSALGATVLRIFNVYGPGQSTDFVVPHLLSGLAGNPVRVGELEHARDYVHVDDVCRAFILALDHPPAPGTTSVMNVGSGRSATVRELAALIEKASGQRLDLVVDPARQRPGEGAEERARCAELAALGFTPETTLEQGIAALVRAAR